VPAANQIFSMKIYIKRFRDARDDDGRTLDMTPDGEFRSPPPGAGWPPNGGMGGPATPWADRLLRYAVLTAILGGAVVIAALALWFALLLIPVVVGAALIGYGAYRWRLWQAMRGR